MDSYFYQVIITLRSGACLNGKIEAADDRRVAEARANMEVALTQGSTISLDLEDGNWAVVSTDCIEQIRLEKVSGT